MHSQHLPSRHEQQGAPRPQPLVNVSQHKPRLSFFRIFSGNDPKVRAQSGPSHAQGHRESSSKRSQTSPYRKKISDQLVKMSRVFRPPSGRSSKSPSKSKVVVLDSDSDDVVEVHSQRVKRPNNQQNPLVLGSPSPEPQNESARGLPKSRDRLRPGPLDQNIDHGVPDPLPAQITPDYMIDGDFEDEDDQMISKLINKEIQQQGGRISGDLLNAANPQAQSLGSPAADETLLQCAGNISAVFPGICNDYIATIYGSVSKSSDRLVAYILDKIDSGTAYPRARKQQALKRKRFVDEDEEATRKYGSPYRAEQSLKVPSTRAIVREILKTEFVETPMTFIDAALARNRHALFPTYRLLEEAHQNFDQQNPTYNKIKKARACGAVFDDAAITKMKADPTTGSAKLEVLEELLAARKIRRNAEVKREEERLAKELEEENTRRAEAEGTMGECGCCYGDFPLNRMVHCENDELHLFCRGCALRNAETEIGNSKYELKCMSMAGCTAGFSRSQRAQFLDETTTIALERNEQEAVLRMAGIENLASCPFCPYAAEYPPVEENRVFECQAPDCEKSSCRLCKLESHIPKSCEEAAKENGLSIRRQIEEAMSAAMIRNCNKCGTPFVKEEGCNKMTCTRNGCYNVQCYVCSKSCGYDHFNDPTRGGKAGNCPLFESVDQRHDQEVKEAERIALEKVRADHPEYTEEDLKVKMSESVLKDDERRKSVPRRVQGAAQMAVVGGAGGLGDLEARMRNIQGRLANMRQQNIPAPQNMLHNPPQLGQHAQGHNNINDFGLLNDGLLDDYRILGEPFHAGFLDRGAIVNPRALAIPEGQHNIEHRQHQPNEHLVQDAVLLGQQKAARLLFEEAINRRFEAFPVALRPQPNLGAHRQARKMANGPIQPANGAALAVAAAQAQAFPQLDLNRQLDHGGRVEDLFVNELVELRRGLQGRQMRQFNPQLEPNIGARNAQNNAYDDIPEAQRPGPIFGLQAPINLDEAYEAAVIARRNRIA